MNYRNKFFEVSDQEINIKIAVYTCITGNYDDLMPPLVHEKNVKYICFLDAKKIIYGWETRVIPFSIKGNAEKNRFAKMMPHLLLADFDASIYIDGNIQLIDNLQKLVQSSLMLHKIALYSHSLRSCIYDEARTCAELGYAWHWKIKRQTKAYKNSGFPKDAGLYECNVIIRKHNDPEIILLMTHWFSEYINKVKRDQISLPFLAWKANISINNLGRSDARFDNNHFKIIYGHNKKISLLSRLRGFINRKYHKLMSYLPL